MGNSEKIPMPDPGERPAEPGRDAEEREGRQAVPRTGKWEASPKTPASLPQCGTQPRARCVSAPVLEEQSPMLGLWWTPRWLDWLGSAHEPAGTGGSSGFAIPVSRHREKCCHNLSAERTGLAAACLSNIPIVKDCQLPLRQWMERGRGSRVLVLPPETCITNRSHSQGAHCRRWFQHP